MPLRIIIDGYNLIRQSPTLRSHDVRDIAQGREKLIEMLFHYRKIKRHPMVVVFDGWQKGNLTEERTKERGIDIIFSKRGEKADEVIKRLVYQTSSEVIVVTSDRGITSFCKSRKCEVIPSPSFQEKMEYAFLFTMKGVEEEDQQPLPPLSTKKKGPSKKPPKSKRRLQQKLKKL